MPAIPHAGKRYTFLPGYRSCYLCVRSHPTLTKAFSAAFRGSGLRPAFLQPTNADNTASRHAAAPDARVFSCQPVSNSWPAFQSTGLPATIKGKTVPKPTTFREFVARNAVE